MFLSMLLPVALIFIFSGCQSQVANNPCQRSCNDGPPQTCIFNFTAHFHFTMSKACYECPKPSRFYTHCYLPNCITAEGSKRPVVVVNGQMPGPSIQVCAGDQVIVNVRNRLLGEGLSLHWHGLTMDQNPYMDGVPMLTQCPISFGSLFAYNFTAKDPGTHLYHSHSGLQRADGLFGSVIVRQSSKSDPQSKLYDFDLPEHVIMLSDWRREMAMMSLASYLFDGEEPVPYTILVNGKGRVARQYKTPPPNSYDGVVPYSTFNVDKGKRYRFRMISVGVMDCSIQMSIDSHTMTVIATDGNPIQPIEVDSIMMTSGERYDFVLTANKSVASYWMRFRCEMELNTTRIFQAAILNYTGAPIYEPAQVMTFANSNRTGKILNPVNIAPGDLNTTISIADLKALSDNKTDWNGAPNLKYFLAFDLYPLNTFKLINNIEDGYPLFGSEQLQRLSIPMINRINFKFPSAPLLSQYSTASDPNALLCNETSVTNCNTTFCSCTYTLQIPLGSLVELILVDQGTQSDSYHPFHIHGTSFRVVAMQRLGRNITLDQVKNMDANGKIKRNLVNAPIKDTVPVPDGGYTIVRFMATNPGLWLLHCDHAIHTGLGMGLILKVGNFSDLPPVPKNFPTCGDWSNNFGSNNQGSGSLAAYTSSSSAGSESSASSNADPDANSQPSAKAFVKLGQLFSNTITNLGY